MRTSIFGLGYVGCVTAACLARDGHTVIGVDLNRQKAEMVGAGQSPVEEPGLDALIKEVVRSGNLKVNFDSQAAVLESQVSLICVGTPSNSNGSLNLQYIENVCGEIGKALATKPDYHVVVIRSTVLPGSVEEKLIPILEQHSGRRAGVDFGVCANPEFLRESSAINDYIHPSFILIGELDQRSGDTVQALYASVDAPVIRTTIQNAQMVKYASNAFHAVKVTFANEIGNLCKVHGMNGQQVMEIFGQDRQLNISPAYLKPGFAFGGSCLPKDLRALLYRAKERDVECSLLSSVLPSNQKQVELGIKLVERTGKKQVGILGLSFKAGTDDLRESPAIILAETLLGRGYQIRIFDETVQLTRLVGANKSYVEKELPHIASLMSPSIEQLVAQSEVLIVTSNSKSFRQIPQMIQAHQTLIDLVGISNGDKQTQATYQGICW
ncbi:GDP-mannose 6-dehydrogenase [Anaerolineae bacterium]|nr:GDP-mannose 6-dehydrogenase [Anaerolineae bacterium]